MSFSLSTQCHMSFTFLNELPSPAEIKQNYPLSDKLKALKKERDAAISAVITGADSRFLVIIGPCSADNEDSVCDYVSRLTSIQEDVADKLILIPRVYTNKPRTTGEGYKGIASQPDPEKAPDMIEGLIAMRKMHIRAIEESGLTLSLIHISGDAGTFGYFHNADICAGERSADAGGLSEGASARIRRRDIKENI